MAKLLKSKRLRQGYTVVSNTVCFDRSLTLKAVGMLVKLLSLPPDWEFSVKGLTAICGDGKDSVRAAIRELERHGYLARARERDEAGRLGAAVYMVFDEPAAEKAASELAEAGCYLVTDSGQEGDGDSSIRGNGAKPQVGTSVGKSDVGKPDVGESATIYYPPNTLPTKPNGHAGKRAENAGSEADAASLSPGEEEALRTLCGLSMKPVEARQARPAFAAALRRGHSARRILAAYRLYAECYALRHPDGETRYAKRLPDWLKSPDGLEATLRRMDGKGAGCPFGMTADMQRRFWARRTPSEWSDELEELDPEYSAICEKLRSAPRPSHEFDALEAKKAARFAAQRRLIMESVLDRKGIRR